MISVHVTFWAARRWRKKVEIVPFRLALLGLDCLRRTFKQGHYRALFAIHRRNSLVSQSRDERPTPQMYHLTVPNKLS